MLILDWLSMNWVAFWQTLGVDVGMHLKIWVFFFKSFKSLTCLRTFSRHDYWLSSHAELWQKIGSGVNSFFLGCSLLLLFSRPYFASGSQLHSSSLIPFRGWFIVTTFATSWYTHGLGGLPIFLVNKQFKHLLQGSNGNHLITTCDDTSYVWIYTGCLNGKFDREQGLYHFFWRYMFKNVHEKPVHEWHKVVIFGVIYM